MINTNLYHKHLSIKLLSFSNLKVGKVGSNLKGGSARNIAMYILGYHISKLHGQFDKHGIYSQHATWQICATIIGALISPINPRLQIWLRVNGSQLAKLKKSIPIMLIP